MKTNKAMLAIPLALTVALASGCTSSNDKDAASSTAPSTTADAQGYNGTTNLKISENPVTVSLFYPFGGNGAPKGDMALWKKAAEITNITMKNVANESITEETQAFNTLMASGELPDLIQGLRTTLSPVMSQGVFIPLDDLINKYAPNIKKFLADYPEARRAGTGADGKIYTIGGTLGGEPGKALPSMGFFIRQDWLDKLNLQTPKTLDEFKKVLYAFREKDPNGNGKKDEVPVFYRDKGIWNLLQLWNATNTWYIGPDDKVHYGTAEPEYKAALTELTQWYKDGIIDPEIFTRGAQARQFLLGNNLGGATVDWFSSTGAVNDAVKAQVPGINFTAIAPPADVNGKVKFAQSREPIHTAAWGISKSAKDPVTLIKYMDFFFSEVGERLMNYGIEGEQYAMVNGQPELKDVVLKHPAGFPNYMRTIGSYEIGRRQSLISEISTMNDIAKKGFEMYQKSDWLMKPFPVMTLTADEQKAVNDALVNLKPFMDEYEQKVLMGAQDINATWDKFLADLKKMNMQKAIDAYNSAYVRYKAEIK